MKLTTLCYIEQDNKYLMLFRNKKKNDPNEGKWIGIGGKLEEGESPEECLLREVREETGLVLTSYKYRGVVTFTSNQWESEQMFLFTSNQFTGDLIECKEGELHWIEKSKVTNLNLWEGDRIFLRLLLSETKEFHLTLQYQGDKLVRAVQDGTYNSI